MRSCRKINESLQSFSDYRLLSTAGEQQTQWRTVWRKLFHSKESTEIDRSHAKRLCTQFSSKCSDRLQIIAAEIATRLASTACLNRVIDCRPSEGDTGCFATCCVAGVTRVLFASWHQSRRYLTRLPAVELAEGACWCCCFIARETCQLVVCNWHFLVKIQNLQRSFVAKKTGTQQEGSRYPQANQQLANIFPASEKTSARLSALHPVWQFVSSVDCCKIGRLLNPRCSKSWMTFTGPHTKTDEQRGSTSLRGSNVFAALPSWSFDNEIALKWLQASVMELKKVPIC